MTEFIYHRTIHFSDTDAAGVVYFARGLSLCHEAYEAALQSQGVDLQQFFSPENVAVPIVHASIDFYQPMYCGEAVQIQVKPQLLDASTFEIHYRLCRSTNLEKPAAIAQTRHVCIQVSDRKRRPLTPELLAWLTDAPDHP